eukprot:5788167-Alexandrium_andersonii.AAC.1
MRQGDQQHDNAVHMLRDRCTFAHLATDSVEVVHGQVQSLLHNRRRGAFRDITSAQEDTRLHSVIKEYSLLMRKLESEVLPSKTTVARVLQHAGAKCRGKYSDRSQPQAAQAVGGPAPALHYKAEQARRVQALLEKPAVASLAA